MSEENTTTYENNKFIKMAIEQYRKTHDADDFIMLLGVLRKRMAEGGEAPTPMVDVNGVMNGFNLEDLNVGQDYKLNEELRLRMDTMRDGDGKEWFPLFTDEEELNKQPTTNITLNVSLEVILNNGLVSERVQGVVINPFGEYIMLPKNILKILFKHWEEEPELNQAVSN